MTKVFFLKLAISNIKKNSKTYIPYILTCILTVTMFYLVKSLSLNPGMEEMIGGDTLSYIMLLGSWISTLFAFIFLFYTSSFLVKRRKKEFGVFNILGMEKRHISKVFGWETFYVMLISLAAGLVIGIALDKILFLLITKMVGAKIQLGFFISGEAIYTTVILFIAIFLLIFLNSVRQIHMANPIELLRAGNVGEKEPKTKWIMAILGILCVGAGYYIALTTENPIASLFMFFIAVILVIIGTYMLFTAGSVAFLKMLRKNRNYYYKTKHFTSISGMIYRMKQNAVSLANICILSTMVLIMISSTTSLMIGMEDIIHTRYPTDFVIYFNENASNVQNAEKHSEECFNAVRDLQRTKNLHIIKEMQYTYLNFTAMCDKDTFYADRDAKVSSLDSMNNLFFISLSDYNRVAGENKTLQDGEILIYSNRKDFDYPTLKVFDKEYSIAEKLDDFIGNGVLTANIANSHFIVVPDKEDINVLFKRQKEAYDDVASEIRVFYGFDSDAGEDEQRAFNDALYELFAEHEDYTGIIESRVDSRQSFIGLYGGFFFIGIFLGILFIMATVLIIYYKQISEGYDDAERFEIMQKVGMSRDEVKASIHSQVLMVFFLPLVVAGIHVAAAFPLISKLLQLMNLMNTELYRICTVVCFLVFAVLYVLIYVLTAKTYCRIVSK